MYWTRSVEVVAEGPIEDMSCISDTVSAKTNLLRMMGDRLQRFSQ